MIVSVHDEEKYPHFAFGFKTRDIDSPGRVKFIAPSGGSIIYDYIEMSAEELEHMRKLYAELEAFDRMIEARVRALPQEPRVIVQE